MSDSVAKYTEVVDVLKDAESRLADLERYEEAATVKSVREDVESTTLQQIGFGGGHK